MPSANRLFEATALIFQPIHSDLLGVRRYPNLVSWINHFVVLEKTFPCPSQSQSFAVGLKLHQEAAKSISTIAAYSLNCYPYSC